MLGSLVAVRTPPDAWHRGVVAEYPNLAVKLDGVVPTPENGGIHIVSLHGHEADAAVNWLRERDAAAPPEPVYREGGHVQMRVRLRDDPLANAMYRTGLTPNFPAPLIDDQYYLFVVGQERPLSEFVERLNRDGLETRLLRRAPSLDGVQDLTAYQYDVLRRALEHGYYDRPRRSTLTDLAQSFGVAKSTLSETLRSVERKAVQRRLNGRYPPGTLRRLPAERAERTTVKNRDK